MSAHVSCTKIIAVTIITALLPLSFAPSLHANNAYSSLIIDQKDHIIQLKGIDQDFYEKKNSPVARPDFMQGQSLLCGIFATYSAYCLMHSIILPKENFVLEDHLTSFDMFTNWLNKNDTILRDIGSERELGNLTSFQIDPIAKSAFSPTEFKSYTSFIYAFVPPSFNPVLNNVINELASKFITNKEPMVVVFNIKAHWIAMAFTPEATIIVDSLNKSRVSHPRIKQLDNHMRRNH